MKDTKEIQQVPDVRKREREKNIWYFKQTENKPWPRAPTARSIEHGNIIIDKKLN